MMETRGGRACRCHERFPNDKCAKKSSDSARAATSTRRNTTPYDTDSNDSPYVCNEDETHTNKKCPKRRYYCPKNDERRDRPAARPNNERLDRKCCDGNCGRPYSSVFTTVVGWTRVAFDWILDKKSHIVVAAVSFVLGTFFDDYCNCLYATGDSDCGC